MPTKAVTKARKTKASKNSTAKTSKRVGRGTKTASASNRESSVGERAGSDTLTAEFRSAKTGRVVKSSPSMPRLGSERIELAVRSFVHGDDEDEKSL